MFGFSRAADNVLVKGLLGLSAAVSCSTASRAQSESATAQRGDSREANWSSLVLPYVPERPRPTLTEPIAGITLLSTSSAKKLLVQFDTIRRSGARPEPELVCKLFEQLSLEPGTEVAPEYFRGLIARYPESPVRAALLKFVYYSPDITVSDVTLEQFWSSNNIDVLKWALLNQSRTCKVTRSPDFFKDYRHNPNPDMRIATSIALISAGFESLRLSNSEILRASMFLTEEHLCAGHETRLVELMAQNIAEGGLTKLKGDDARAVAAPLLHLLQRVTKLSPEFSRALLSADSATFDRFSVSLLEAISRARTDAGEKIVLSKESRVLVGLHYEQMFTHVMLEQLFENVGVSRIKYVKAGELRNAPSGPYGSEPQAFPDSVFRRRFLKKLEEIKSPEPKREYLAELRELARDRTAPALVWNIMHGSTRKFAFYHGQAGVSMRAERADPREISDEEVVEALVSHEHADKKEIDLSHMTFICDACRQYTVAEGILDGIERVAYQRGAVVKGYPSFVVLTQPYMYGSLSYSVFGEVPKPGDNSGLPKDGIDVGMTVCGPFDGELRRLGKRREPVRLRDLFVADNEALTKHREGLKDLKRLKGLRVEVVRSTDADRPDSSGLRVINTQDPAIFSPFPLSLEVIRAACEESGLPTDGLKHSRQSFFIEVSNWSPDLSSKPC